MAEEYQEHVEKEKVGFYEKHYKKLLIIPIALVVLSILFLGFKFLNGEEIVKKDITLTGGVSLTITTDKEINIASLKKILSQKFEEVLVRRISEVGIGVGGVGSGSLGIIVEAKTEDVDALKAVVSDAISEKLTEENTSIEITGPSLGKTFLRQLIQALVIAFIFMAIVVFLIFRNFVPSLLVIFAAAADILIALTYVSLIDMRIGTAGIAAFLMLIGYSIDTDILLTTRMLKRKEKEMSQRMLESFKTGIMMTLTSLAVILLASFFVISPILKQIFVILSAGLVADLITTWCFNAPALRIYLEKTGKA